MKTFSTLIGGSARKKDLGGEAQKSDLAEKSTDKQFLQEASPPKLPHYDIIMEDFRGMMRYDQKISLHSDKADYYLRAMSPHGFVEALDPERYIIKIRRPEGRTLYVILAEKSFGDEKKNLDKRLIIP